MAECTPTLPRYTPSLPAPAYSCEPSLDEQRLLHNPRRFTPIHTGTFVKKTGKVTVVLNNQKENAENPTYVQNDHLTGAVLIEGSSSVSEVILKIEGRIDSTNSEAGSKSIKLVNDTYTLWPSATDQHPNPTQIPFDCVIPATYKVQEGEAPLPLPPSYHYSYTGIPALLVRIYYSITIIVTQTRRFGSKNTRVAIPFVYQRRARPHRPIIGTSFFAIKTDPGEWFQSTSVMKTCPELRPQDALICPITAQLFIPVGRIYGLNDSIPFHIQLSGTIPSLRALPALARVCSSEYRLSDSAQGQPLQSAPVRLYLLRQISVEIRGKKIWRDIILGEADLCSIPPLISCHCIRPCLEDHLDWDGFLHCNKDVTVGSFATENVSVKDFIMLTLTPSNRHSSPLLEHQFGVPIRLVTDTWAEVIEPF